jgi:hypothetical protein
MLLSRVASVAVATKTRRQREGGQQRRLAHDHHVRSVIIAVRAAGDVEDEERARVAARNREGLREGCGGRGDAAARGAPGGAHARQRARRLRRRQPRGAQQAVEDVGRERVKRAWRRVVWRQLLRLCRRSVAM